MTEKRQRATRESWHKLQPLPAKTSQISLDREFTEDEFEKLSLGLVPVDMDDKWFIFLEANTFYFHRSWTGTCIYQMGVVKERDVFVADKILVNREVDQYKETDDGYDERLLLFLIENLLLGNQLPFPVPSNIFGNYPKGVLQHNIAGTGFPEVEVESE